VIFLLCWWVDDMCFLCFVRFLCFLGVMCVCVDDDAQWCVR
jgi:hypothetical protein